MHLTLRSIVPLAVLAATASFAAGCSDATAPAPHSISASSTGASFGRPRGGGGVPLGIPTTLNRPGGAHFELGCDFQGNNCFYMPINAAAFAYAPHGLTLAGVRIP